MNLRKKFVTLMLSLGLVAGMGTAAFAADDAAVNLLPYPDKGEFNKVVTYNPNGNPDPVDLMVQGANINYLPEPFSATKAASVQFNAFDGVSVGSTSAIPISNNGSNYAAKATVTVPTSLSYGPKMVNASIPGSTGWNGKLDLGVILNSTQNLSARNVRISFYNGRPGEPGTVELKNETVRVVSPGTVQSDIKYASALDAAKKSATDIDLAGSGINQYARKITVGGVTLEEDPVNHIGWSYRIYNNSGNVQNNSDKVGAEVAPVSGGFRVVWAYGPWDVLN